MKAISPETFIGFGMCILRLHVKFRHEAHDFRWRATFGAPPGTCSTLWKKIDPDSTMPNGAQPYHLLWGLMFMKLYCAEAVNTVLAGGVDVKTFRKWSWLFAEAVAVLHSSVVGVLLANRYERLCKHIYRRPFHSCVFLSYLYLSLTTYARYFGRIGDLQITLAIPVSLLSMEPIFKSTNQIPSGRAGGRTNSTDQAFVMSSRYAF